MTAYAVLTELRDAGLEVVVDCGNLRLRGNTSALTPALRERVSAAKPDLIGLLTFRERLSVLAEANGMDPSLVDDIPDADISAFVGHSDVLLLASLKVLSDHRLMASGAAPAGWTETVVCHGCGPVYLWRGCPSHVIACPWCRHRKAGIAIPTPPPHLPLQDEQHGSHEPA